MTTLGDILVGAFQVFLLWGAYVGILNLLIWTAERFLPPIHKD